MRNYFLLISIMLMVWLAACGTANTNEEDSLNAEPVDSSGESSTKETEDISSVMENLELQVKAEQEGDKIDFTFQLVNKNKNTVDLTFSSSQQFDIKLSHGNQLIYQYSHEQMFSQALVEESLAPGEMKKWTETWEISQSLEPGEYEVEMILLPSQINGQQVEGEPLQQAFTITLEPITSEGDPDNQHESFRSVEVEGENGEYTVTGEVDTSAGVTYYEVEDGHNYFVEQTEIPVEGDGWQEFEINVSIAEDLLPQNGAVVMLLFNEDRSEQMPVQLDVTK